jgi:hypothetical protein
MRPDPDGASLLLCLTITPMTQLPKLHEPHADRQALDFVQ